MATAVPLTRGASVSALVKSRTARWLKVLCFCAIVLFIHGRVVADLAVDWWTIPSQSQGLLIPPLALYIAWERRHTTWDVPISPDSRGLIGVGAACILFLLGKMGAEFFFMRTSFVLLLVSTVVTFWGWRRLRTLALPFLLLATMVPLPALVY